MNPRLSALEENVWKNRNKNTLCALMEDRVKFQEGSNDSSSAPIVHHNPVDGAAPRRPSLKQTSIPNVTEIPDASSTQNNGVIAADELTLNIPAVWDDIFPTIDESVYDRYYSNSIQDYELISPIGVEETAFIYLAKFIPSGEYIALRYTDLTIAPDAEFLDELLVSSRLFAAAIFSYPYTYSIICRNMSKIQSSIDITAFFPFMLHL